MTISISYVNNETGFDLARDKTSMAASPPLGLRSSTKRTHLGGAHHRYIDSSKGTAASGTQPKSSFAAHHASTWTLRYCRCDNDEGFVFPAS